MTLTGLAADVSLTGGQGLKLGRRALSVAAMLLGASTRGRPCLPWASQPARPRRHHSGAVRKASLSPLAFTASPLRLIDRSNAGRHANGGAPRRRPAASFDSARAGATVRDVASEAPGGRHDRIARSLFSQSSRERPRAPTSALCVWCGPTGAVRLRPSVRGGDRGTVNPSTFPPLSTWEGRASGALHLHRKAGGEKFSQIATSERGQSTRTDLPRPLVE
jgi:hypothetical protein